MSISYFYPRYFRITFDDFSPFEQEPIELLLSMLDAQHIIFLEFIRQQAKAYDASMGKKHVDDYLIAKPENSIR